MGDPEVLPALPVLEDDEPQRSVSAARGVPKALGAGNPAGQLPRRRLAASFRGIVRERPSELQRSFIASFLGLPSVDDVPDYYDTLAELLWWARCQQACRGNESALADIFDRVFPKPRRTEISGPEGGPVRSHITASSASSEEAAAARLYFEQLEAGGDEDEGAD